MNTSYRITATNGLLIETVSDLDEARGVLSSHPGATVKPVVTIDQPCNLHPAFEADYCPACGTARSI